MHEIIKKIKFEEILFHSENALNQFSVDFREHCFLSPKNEHFKSFKL